VSSAMTTVFVLTVALACIAELRRFSLYSRAPRRAGFYLIGDRMTTCPECDAEIEVDEFDVDKGDQLSCPECGSNLEVVGLSPIELDIAPEDDDDDDDDDDEAEDDAEVVEEEEDEKEDEDLEG
jgi:alpha-aminoadipate carrier protein LysW